MPGISPSSSTEPNPPCSSRKSRIFCAVSGPIPLSVSSCSSVAVLRLSGCPGAGAGAGRAAGRRRAAAAARPLRHEHLPPVLELGREVEPAEVGPPRRAARARDRVVDPRARAQPVDARSRTAPATCTTEPPAAAVLLDRDRRRRLAAAGAAAALSAPAAPQLAQPEQRASPPRPATQSASWRGVSSVMPPKLGGGV